MEDKTLINFAAQYSLVKDIGSQDAFLLRLAIMQYVEADQLFVELIVKDDKKRMHTMDLKAQIMVKAKYYSGKPIPPENRMLTKVESIWPHLLEEGSIQVRGLDHFFVVDNELLGKFEEPKTRPKLQIQK